ncbi:MAG: D,D-heptose 1,7-bisphosphate phosphatase [Alphaproteobacteria bacterium 32-64-14]|nr:MAG: D,D-heptose 1,7-bisphosphate phosphatase [Alphaproteobacteria bacterium 32-64-14]
MPDMAAARPALFLDRDGVINVDRNYIYRVADFDWIDGAQDVIRRFNAMGWWVFIVTNQSGIARGLYTEEQMQTLHDWMTAELDKSGARIDRIYHCPFHEDGTIARYRKDSFDRKPKPGMLIRAMTDFPVIKERSLMIGDKQADMEAAKAAGVRGFLFSGGDLASFTDWALADMGEGR